MTFLKHGFIGSGFLNLSTSEAYKEVNEIYPVFTGKVKHCLHTGFDDP
jgi:hypothetical protein